MHAIRRRRPLSVLIAALGAAALVTVLTGLGPASSAAGGPELRLDSPARVHWNGGKPLTGRSDQAPGQVVAQYVRGHVSSDVSGLRTTAAWTDRGIRQVRMEQYVGGLRVHDGYAKAAVDASGRLISLIENSLPSSTPVGAAIDEDAALRAAVGNLYPGRSVTTAAATRSGTVTTYPQQGFSARPTVERVAVPTRSGGVAEAFEVTTWDAQNRLHVSLVSGDGAVVDTVLRTASDSYNVFPEDPEKTPQTVVDGTGTWVSGSQLSRNIDGAFAHAYLDADADNAPDSGGSEVTDGNFLSPASLGIQPSSGTNPDVAVQNLFYLNSLIHDTLFAAGFTAAAGNFQKDGGDAVNAEAQDGGGTDNANFATPVDGQAPRMQMYLWNSPTTHQVLSGATTYDATGATWGPALSTTGLTGTLVRANPADACTTLQKVTAGSLVLADRGTCNFTDKALNAQTAGAAGIIVANNVDGSPITMGGTSKRVKIPGVMVSKADGLTLGGKVGTSVTIRLADPPPIMRDGDVDSDIVWHEYGHGLTWRMIGQMDGPLAGAVGEGMSDVLSIIVNDDPIVGEYAMHDPAGIRRASYDGYTLITYGDITGTEVHDDGEVYGAIGWSLWKRYVAAGLGRSDILADLVDGMNYTPAKPTFEQMRDGILAGLAANQDTLTPTSRSCMVWRSFAEHGVGVGAKGVVRGKKATVAESFTTPPECA